MDKLNYEKYKGAFSYLLSKLGNIEGKKKACKLFYFLDFDFFEAFDESFTGETYIKKQMGPFPKYFEGMAKEMQKDGYVKIKEQKMRSDHQNNTVTYELLKVMPYDFSGRELKMLNRVASLYGCQNGKMLEDLSHTQAPWLAVSMNEEIPYELSYYRDTNGLTE